MTNLYGPLNEQSIADHGQVLAFDVAAAADDKTRMRELTSETLRRVGPEAFPYVVASALWCLAHDILEPTFCVAASYGADSRPGLRKIAAAQKRPGA